MPVGTRDSVVSAASRVRALTTLFMLLVAQPGLAQESSSVTVDIADCAALESAEARLACFGARVDAALKNREPAQDEREDEAEPEAPVAEERASPDESANRKARRRELVADERGDESSGVVVELRETLPNAYLITLDNGQVWQQTEPEQYPLRPGLEVRIYPSSWGRYYRLSGRGTGSYIKVRKVR